MSFQDSKSFKIKTQNCKIIVKILIISFIVGNHYGTPKPPQYPPNQGPNQHPSNTENTSTKSSDHRPGARPSSSGKRARNKSTITATTLNAPPVDDEEQRRRDEIERLEEELGELPGNWEIAFTEQGDMYFIE